MKLDAFQRVEELQSRLDDAVRASVPMSSPGGKQILCSEGLGSELGEILRD